MHNKKVISVAMNFHLAELDWFARESQLMLGGEGLRRLNPEIQHETIRDMGDFLNSKPRVNPHGLTIYSYRPNAPDTSAPFGCVWLKLKTPESIHRILQLPGKAAGQATAVVQAHAFQMAEKRIPEVVRFLEGQGVIFHFEERNLHMGPLWVMSRIGIRQEGAHITIITPILKTDEKIPVLGGMNYCKLLMPGDAAAFMINLANVIAQSRVG